MVVPPVHRVRVVRRASDDADAIARAVADREWARGAEVLKRTDRTSVLAGDACGRAVVAKCVRVDRVSRRLALLAGRSRLAREWRGREQLARAGVDGARFFAHVVGRDERGGLVECLVMERVPGRSLIRVIADGGIGVRHEHALARRVGELTGSIVRSGLRNGDHKASNIMVSGSGIALVDVGEVKRTRTRDGAGMLGKLAIECTGVGVLPRRALLMRALRAYSGCVSEVGQEHVMWRRIESIVDAHGDATPKDDPLQ